MKKDNILIRQQPIYVLLHLRTQHLTGEFQQRLESLGFSCIEEIAPNQAYAVMPDLQIIWDRIAADPDVVAIELHEPPTGM